MSKSRFGCSSIINAINLQFDLAGHGLYTEIRREVGNEEVLWWCASVIKRPAVGTMTAVRKHAHNAPQTLTWESSHVG